MFINSNAYLATNKLAFTRDFSRVKQLVLVIYVMLSVGTTMWPQKYFSTVNKEEDNIVQSSQKGQIFLIIWSLFFTNHKYIYFFTYNLFLL